MPQTFEGGAKTAVLRRLMAFSDAWRAMHSAATGLEVVDHQLDAALHELAAARLGTAEFDRRKGQLRQALAERDVATEKYARARDNYRRGAPLRELAALETKYDGGDLFVVLLEAFEQAELTSDSLLMLALSAREVPLVRRLHAGEPVMPIMQAWFAVEHDLEK